jgi:hypothetical protein
VASKADEYAVDAIQLSLDRTTRVADKAVESGLDNASRIQTVDEALQAIDAKYSNMITKVKEDIADVAKVADQRNSQTSQRLKTLITNYDTYTTKTNEILGNLVTKKDI